MQPELFEDERGPLRLTPAAGRTEPRLWVRRLVIWRDADTILREVKLRPGLNIVWSPDSSGAGEPIGHGGGKTTFCRLLRYGLGEDSFAPKSQARRTLERLPTGRVGLEVRLDGQNWAIVRGFSGAHEDWAVPNAPLDYTLGAIAATGMEPFCAAVTAALLTPVTGLLPARVGKANAWPVILAWLTRDQECRFGHLLDWRDKDSDSASPARNISSDDRLTIVRAALGAMRSEELLTKATHEDAVAQAALLQQKHERLIWQAQDWRRGLAGSLGIDPQQPPSELDAGVLCQTAEEHWSKVMGAPATAIPDVLEAARVALGGDEAALRQASEALAVHRVLLEGEKRLAAQIVDELPELSARAQAAPLCPVCHIPIDKARAEGCGISLTKCDLEALRANVDRLKASLIAARKREGELAAQTQALQYAAGLAQQNRDRQSAALSKLLNAATQRTAQVRSAERLVEDAYRLVKLVADRDKTAEALKAQNAERERLKEALDQHRAGVVELLRTLSDLCNQLLRRLIPGEVRGRAVLDGNGLHLHVQLSGDRSTAAIESLKVVIFDLAVLSLTVEGRAHLPGFLLHDSPREADLGLSIYHELFPLLHELESIGPNPLFQYIVTTTTAPPQAFQHEPWFRLELRGAPAAERLLGIDL